MKTKIYQVKPTRNIVVKNIIGQIKTQWIDYIVMETKNKFLRNQVKELSQKLSERNKQKERMREETGEKKIGREETCRSNDRASHK